MSWIDLIELSEKWEEEEDKIDEKGEVSMPYNIDLLYCKGLSFLAILQRLMRIEQEKEVDCTKYFMMLDEIRIFIEKNI